MAIHIINRGATPRIVRGRNEIGDYAGFIPHNIDSFLSACKSLQASRSEIEKLAYEADKQDLISASAVMWRVDDEE